MWDQRYDVKEYIYGKEPNDFLREKVNTIPKGAVLTIAEGEGRNAVFLAKQGYQVTAVDASIVGLKKAEQLAKAQNVDIELVHADLTEFDFGVAHWQGIVSIFCPLPSKVRQVVYNKIQAGLKPNGVFMVEAYTPNQIAMNTGGGKDPDVMQTVQSLSSELDQLQFSTLQELEREVVEGIYHTGLASVVQGIGVKV